MKLRRLKIEKFRNVQPGTELEFNDGYNVLLGQNGSGKTTLLRLISSVLRGDFQWLENEAFVIEAELEGAHYRVNFSIRHERQANAKKPLEAVPAELQAFLPSENPWSNEINSRIFTTDQDAWEVTQNDNGFAVQGSGLVHPEKVVAKWQNYRNIHVFHTIFVVGSLLRQKQDMSRFPDDWVGAVHRLIEAFRFDESLEVFSCITGRGSKLGKPEYADIVGRIKTILQKQGTGNVAVGPLIPPNIQAHDALKNPNFDSPADTIIIKHDQAEFLAKVTPMLGYVGSELKLDLLGKEVTDEQQKIEYGNLRFFFHGRDGSIVNQDHLSYGQKRLLTFFYYVACNPHVVVADELVNGLHHAWIAECIRAMGDRQVFVTSQNPVLLDHLSFNSAEQVRRTFITCEAKPEGVKDRITWANMTKKNADAFYRAYKVGAQHVGEILRTKGFW